MKESHLFKVIGLEKSSKITEYKDDVKIEDNVWTKSKYMVPDKDIPNEVLLRNRYFTSAEKKFTDSSFGGHVALNPRPQFTRYADVRYKGRLSGRTRPSPSDNKGNHGQGRYYSDAIDDNTHVLYLEFGVPDFNGFFSFLVRAVSREEMMIANYGYLPKSYKIGTYIGRALALYVFGVLRTAIGLLVEVAVHKYALNTTDEFYRMRPEMPQFWGIANSLITKHAIESGVYGTEAKKTKKDKIGMPISINKEDQEDLHKLMPDLFSEDGFIDIYAMATRTQKLILEDTKTNIKKYGHVNNPSDDLYGYVKTKYSRPNSEKYNDLAEKFLLFGITPSDEKKKDESADPVGVNIDSGEKSILDNAKDIVKDVKGTVSEVGDMFSNLFGGDNNEKDDKEIEKKNEKDKDGLKPAKKDEKKSKYLERSLEVLSYFTTSFHEGGQFAPLRVEYVGGGTDSFSNIVGDIPIKDKFNSVGGAARNIRFSMAGGNIVGDFVKDITDSIGNVLTGTLETYTFGLSNIVFALFGGGYTEFPKMWKDSQAQLDQHTFKIDAISPYGNIYSRLVNQLIPLYVLLAGTLPLGTGSTTYTSPFLCSAYLRGICNIKMGMITNLTIRKATSHLAYDKYGVPLALEITFTITDFSNIAAARVVGGNNGFLNLGRNDDKLLDRFIATLAGRTLYDNRYFTPNALREAMKKKYGLDSLLSPARAGLMLNDLVGAPFNALSGDIYANKLAEK